MKQSKTMRIVLVLLLVAIIAVGSTWAYLYKVTNDETNKFTFLGSDALNAILDEPHWEDPNGLNLTPGAIVPKDPLVENTGAIDEYVALKLTFQTKDSDEKKQTLTQEQMDILLSLISFQYKLPKEEPEEGGEGGEEAPDTYGDGFSPVWVICDPDEAGTPFATYYTVHQTLANQIADTEAPLSPTEKTSPIFDRIIFSADMTNEQLDWLCGGAALPKLGQENEENPVMVASIDGFDIYIEGAAVQADTFDITEALQSLIDALYGLLNPAPIAP